VTPPERPSIHDLAPREPGAEEARRGFQFQDHVAAGFFLEMLESEELSKVWCEAEDDITLVRERGGTGTEIEFVQVKSDEHDQLWSLSLLCRQESGTRIGTSILERSLSRDRHREPCWFRIVTVRPVMHELEHLQFPCEHPERQPGTSKYERLVERVPEPLREFLSENGNDWTYWIARATWDVRHSEDAVRTGNSVRLEDVLRGRRAYLAPDQRRVIYERLVRRAMDAATARRISAPQAKCVRRDELAAFLNEAIREAQRAGALDTEPPLERKLREAGLSDVTIRHAKDVRRRYSSIRRRNAYYSPRERDRIEEEVSSRLHRLWSRLEAGELDDTPARFYDRCLAELETIRTSISPENPPPLIMLQGMMYERVRRCVHRFDTASV
jgi:hypothetical protein